MIVRTVFSVLVVAGLLAGTALWNGPPREPQSEFAPIGELAREIAAKVEATVREVKPVVEGLASMAEVRHKREPVSVEPAVAPTPAAAPEPAPVLTAEREGQRPATKPVVEVEIEPVEALPFLEGPPEVAAELESVAAPEESAVVALTDQDEWAGLIRRMLALYERVAPTR